MSRSGALPPDLASKPAEEALRWIALSEIERARASRRAIGEGADPEALHDFRVAIRRLRSHLRAWRAEIGGTVRPGARRRLKRLAAATNPARDAEVGCELVARWSAAAAGAEGRALAALAADFERRRDAAYEAVRSEVLQDFDRTARELEGGLRRYEVELGGLPREGSAEPYRSLLASRLSAHGDELRAALDESADERTDACLHAARIRAKRLRYLAEPVLGELAAARPLVDRLKELQDALGGARDLALLGERLAASAGKRERERLRAAAGGPTARPGAGGRSGRLALARRIAEERATLDRQIDRDWLAPRAGKRVALDTALGDLVGELAETLSPPARPGPSPGA